MRLKADRRLLVAGSITVSVILCIFLVSISLSLKKDLGNQKSQQKEMFLIKDEFLSLKNKVDTVDNKKSLTKIEGIVQATDEVFQPLGLKKKVKSVKPTGTKDLKETVEEEAEVQVEKVDMNEMVNIFHKIENSPFILSVKKTTIKTSFENPTLLDITMTIALIKPK